MTRYSVAWCGSVFCRLVWVGVLSPGSVFCRLVWLGVLFPCSVSVFRRHRRAAADQTLVGGRRVPPPGEIRLPLRQYWMRSFGMCRFGTAAVVRAARMIVYGGSLNTRRGSGLCRRLSSEISERADCECWILTMLVMMSDWRSSANLRWRWRCLADGLALSGRLIIS